MTKKTNVDYEVFSNYKEFNWNFLNTGSYINKKKHLRYLHNELFKNIEKITPDIILHLIDNKSNDWNVSVVIRNSLLSNLNEGDFKNSMLEIYKLFFNADQTKYKLQWKDWKEEDLVNNLLTTITEASKLKIEATKNKIK